ncbi:MAG: AI-2E family transporter [Eubacteriales bacterium]
MKLQQNNHYKTICAYVVCTFSVCLLIALIFINIAAVSQGLLFLIDIFMPFIIGFALAYLLNRPVNFIEKHVFSFLERKRSRPLLRRNLSILLLYLVLFCALFLLILYIIPQLVSSLNVLFQTLPGQIETLRQDIVSFAKSAGFGTPSMERNLNIFFSTFLDVTKYLDHLFMNAQAISTKVSGWVFKITVGIIVSVYFLAGKKKFALQAKKLSYALFPLEYAKRFIRILRYSSDVFIKYIIGMLLDGLIVSTITFIFLWILGFPYPLLAAVIIGTTNIIPLFGPIIGAAACAVIIFVISPVTTLWFLIFIVILQQIDGNVIMPHIVGQTTRLQAFWVLFALILGGGLFGFWGLLLGVPVWAVLYSLIAAAVNKQLRKKNILPCIKNSEKTEKK